MVAAVLVHGATVSPSAAHGGVPTVKETYAAPQHAAELASAKAFLLARPLGVYTCGRAVPSDTSNSSKFHLVLWDFHIRRLTCGLQIELQVGSTNEALLQALRTTTTKLVIQALRDAADTTDSHAMVTILWSVDGSAVRIDVHVCPMPQVRMASRRVRLDCLYCSPCVVSRSRSSGRTSW
jgi:hypothetical protein